VGSFPSSDSQEGTGLSSWPATGTHEPGPFIDQRFDAPSGLHTTGSLSQGPRIALASIFTHRGSANCIANPHQVNTSPLLPLSRRPPYVDLKTSYQFNVLLLRALTTCIDQSLLPASNDSAPLFSSWRCMCTCPCSLLTTLPTIQLSQVSLAINQSRSYKTFIQQVR
jgi:hypothetical protein